METPALTAGTRGSDARDHEDALWAAVDRLLSRADVAGIVAHKLGPLAARRLRLLDEPVPAPLRTEERVARLGLLTAAPLLERIRAVAPGPLLLVKGPEVAWLYPGRARSFVDVDLLSPEPDGVHAALRAAGFEEVDDPELFKGHHHLRPLQEPGQWLKVEIHLRPMLPEGVGAPPMAELVEAAVPSALGIDGISAPHPVHHALVLAVHGWVHDPLGTVRDLLDVAAVAQGASEAELARTARTWGVERIWQTTRRASSWLFEQEAPSVAVRTFGRHLADVRERTVVENHLVRWLCSFWELPLRRAVLTAGDVLREEILPQPGESWRAKITRVRHAILHPRRAMSAHTAGWRRDVADVGPKERE